MKSNDNVFDQVKVGPSDKFSETDLQKINTALEKYITEDSNYFAELMAENPDQTLDYLIDNLKADADNKSRYKEWVWDFLLENDLNSLEEKTEYIGNIDLLKKDLKELEVEITGQWFFTMMSKVDTNLSLNPDNVGEYKNTIAQSYLEWYIENLTNSNPTDDQLIIDELMKVCIPWYDITTLVANLKTKTTRSVEIDPSTNKIKEILFSDPWAEESPDTEEATDGYDISWWDDTPVDPNQEDKPKVYDKACITCGDGGDVSQTIKDPESPHGTDPTPGEDVNNEDEWYLWVKKAIKTTSNVTVAYQASQNYYLHNHAEGDSDTEWDISSAREAVRRFLKWKEEDLDIVDKDAKLSRDEKKELKELKKAIMGDGLAFRWIGLDNFGDVFVTMTYLIDRDDNTPIDTEEYREKYHETDDVETDMKNTSREAKKLAVLGRNFVKRRKQEYNGTYIERFFDLINDQIMNVGEWKDFRFDKAYNKRNDNDDVILEGKEKTIVEEKDRRWVKNLITLNGNGELTEIMSMVRQSKRGEVDMNKVINAIHNETNDKILWTTLVLNESEKKIAQHCIDQNMYKTPKPSNSFTMIAEALASGMEPEDVCNMITILTHATIDDTRFGDSRTWWVITPASEFIYRLGDYTFDGKVWFNDTSGMLSGAQLQAASRSAEANIAYAKYDNDLISAEKDVVANILCYTSVLAKQNGDLYFYNVIEEALTSSGAQKIDGERDASTINVEMLMDTKQGFLVQHPWVFHYIQNVMSNPAIPVQAIMEYGASAFTKYHKATKDSYTEYAAEVNVTPEQLAKISTMADTEWRKLVAEAELTWTSKYLEWQREHFMTNFGGAVIAMSQGPWFGVWIGMERLLSKLGSDGGHTLSAWLQVGVVNGIPTLGFWLHYHGDIADWWSLDGSTGVSANTSTGFIPLPMTGLSLSKERDINKDTIKKNLEARWYQTLHVWPEVKLIWLVPMVWIHAWIDINRMKGIETQYASIRKDMNAIATALINTSWVPVEGDAVQIKEAVQKNIALTRAVINKSKFADTDPKIKQTMAENLYKAVVHFGCLDVDGLGKTRASEMLAEYFSLEWKNQAVERLKWWFSGVDVGLNRVIGTMIFLPSLAISFEKYYGGYSADTQESKRDAQWAEERWYGNRSFHFDGSPSDVRDMWLLNNKISVAARFETYQPLLDNEKIRLVDNSNLIMIPKDLFALNILNVKIDISLKWKVWYDEDGNLYVPKNQSIRPDTELMGQHSVSVLNIGDNRTKATSYHLIYGREEWLKEQWWLCDVPSLAEYEQFVADEIDSKNGLVVSSKAVDDAFTALKNIPENSHFPQFTTVGEAVDGKVKVTSTSKIFFEPWSESLLSWKSLALPTTGKLTVRERKVGGVSKFYLQYDWSSTDPLIVEYLRLASWPLIQPPLTETIINEDSAMKNLYAHADFPLSKATGVKDKIISFDIKNGVDQNTLTTQPPVAYVPGSVSIPVWHELSVTYDTQNKKYTLSASDDPITEPTAQKFRCRFTTITNGWPWPVDTEEHTMDFDSLLELSLDSIRDIFTNSNVDALSELEDLSANRDLYYTFMEVLNSSRINFVTQNNIDSALLILKKILTNGNAYPKSKTACQILLTKIDAIASDDYTSKTYILSRMKQIFSLESTSYIGVPIATLYTKRSSSYDMLAAKEWLPFDTQWYMGKFKDMMSEKFQRWSYDEDPEDVLIWFTAYYRNNKGQTENKWFSLSWLDDVNIYKAGDKYAIETIEEDKKDLATTWFINKLQKNESELAITKDSYRKLIEKIEWITPFNLSDDQCITLLRWETITANGRSIRFDNEMVAYLQWECANQWLGMRIGKMHYTVTTDDDGGWSEEHGEWRTTRTTRDINPGTGEWISTSTKVVATAQWPSITVNDTHTLLERKKKVRTIVLGASLKLGNWGVSHEERDWPWPTDPGGDRWGGNPWGEFDDQVNG